MTTLLCINPKSRSGASADCEPFVECLHRLGPVVIHRLGEEGLEDSLAALDGRLQRIVVGGGDGTLNRALPMVLEAGVPLGVLPLGTANDFARALGLPADPEAALEVVLAGHTRKIGLGRANDQWFLNAAGIGLGPDLTKKLDHDKKQRLGVLAYLSSLLEVVGNRRARRALLEVNGFRKRVPFMQITVANGIHYGGGLTIAQGVGLNDGELHVLLLQPQTPLELVGKFFALLRGVKRNEEKDKLKLLSGDRVSIKTKASYDVTLDGELATTTPLECRCVPDAIEVYAPAPSPPAAD